MRGIICFLALVATSALLIMPASVYSAVEQEYATLTWKSGKLMGWLDESWGLAVEDVNGDGVKDIIAAVNGNNISIFDGVTHKEISRFQVANSSLWSYLFNYEYIAQMDTDSDKELVLGALGLLGGHIFIVDLKTHEVKDDFYTSGECMLVGDVDGDGISEIITGGNNISVYKLGNSAPIKVSADLYGDAVAMKIANVDGKNMLFVASVKIEGSILNPQYYSRLYEFTLPDLTMTLNISAGERDARVIDVADVNGDGKSEIIVGGDLTGLTSNGYIQIYSLNGTLISKKDDFSSSVANIKVADLREDGNMEMVVATDSIKILYPTNFTLIWSSGTLYDVGMNSGMVITDLAGNGTTEIIVWAYSYTEGGRIYEYTITKPVNSQENTSTSTTTGLMDVLEKYLIYLIIGIAAVIVIVVAAVAIKKKHKKAETTPERKQPENTKAPEKTKESK